MTIFLILCVVFVACHLAFSWFGAWQKGQSYRRLSRQTSSPITDKPITDDVTIIIPAWNDSSVLERTFLALRQEVRSFPHRVQVIVVAGGKDQCYEKARELRQRVIPETEDWTVLQQQPRGKNAALNQALTRAAYPIIVFLDADTQVQRGWLSNLITPLVTGEAAASAGFFEGYKRTSVTAIFELDQLVSQIMEEKNTLFGGGSIALTKRTLETLGGQLPEDVLVGVDWDLSERVRNAGLPRRFAAEAKVRTELPQSWQDYWQTEVRWRRAFYKVELQHFQQDKQLKRLFGLLYVPLIQALLLAGWFIFPVLFYLLAGAPLAGFIFWLLFSVWVLGRHGSTCLKAYSFTRDASWLRLIPAYLWSFCVSALATWQALFTLQKLNAHFKGRRAEVTP